MEEQETRELVQQITDALIEALPLSGNGVPFGDIYEKHMHRLESGMRGAKEQIEHLEALHKDLLDKSLKLTRSELAARVAELHMEMETFISRIDSGTESLLGDLEHTTITCEDDSLDIAPVNIVRKFLRERFNPGTVLYGVGMELCMRG